MRRATLVFLLMTMPNVLHAQLRPDVMGTQAAVVADHPLAAAAGADVLRKGGNAMDAAITMAGVLAVVRPHMNGVGGDMFLLYRDAKSGKVFALNGSGRAGALATPSAIRRHGLREMPDTGMLTVTVPGAVRAWSDALRRFGTYSLGAALEPAIRYAENGFPVSSKLAADIESERVKISRDRALADVYLRDGKAPKAGSILREHDLAATLRTIAEEGADALYAGPLAQRIAGFAVEQGGLFTLQDLANHSSTWQEPVSTDYHGLRVYTPPPNSQGIALLMQLNVAEQFDLQHMGLNSSDYIHTLVEIKKRVFADRDRYIADPAFTDVPLDRLLSGDYARDVARAMRETVGGPMNGGGNGNGNGDTVFLCAVDKNGNAVALIQSLYAEFGSGHMVPGTGIILHNRGALFSLDEKSPNVVAPNKRPYHTLSPGLVTQRDQLVMVFGTPGSDGQTQTMLQVLNDIALFKMMPQDAVDAPRYRSYPDGTLLIDSGVSSAVRADLARRGHRVKEQEKPSADMGSAQVILVTPAGVKIVGADQRREAYGIAW